MSVPERPLPRFAIRAFDALFGFLLAPRVRRVRRWSFLVTAPLGFLVGRKLGLDLGDGVLLGAVAAVLDVAVIVAVAALGTRVLGPERRDALLDLLMHPVARRAVTGEARMLATLPRAAWRRLRPRTDEERFACHRGSSELAIALALLPPMAAEGAAVHLLLPGDWVGAKIALLVLNVYAMVMILSWAVGERTRPHRLRHGWLELRSGTLYRLRVPADAIVSVERHPHREGQRSGFVPGDSLRLAVAGRTDVRLRFRSPVLVERPLGDPVAVSQLEVAVDDPDRLLAALAAARRTSRAPATRDRGGVLAWGGAADLAGALS